jgi:LuxR family maltose regulon positive regulatory protein
LERTQGWAAGLRLRRTLQEKAWKKQEFIQSFSGSHRYVADYLIKEVFENQAEAVKSFLLKTCFLDRLTGSLCDAVTGATGGAAMLEQLARGNLFIVQLERGGEQIWYRYNPLFAESIQYLARQRLSGQVVKSIFEKAGNGMKVGSMKRQNAALAAKLTRRAITRIKKFIVHDLTEMHARRLAKANSREKSSIT